MRVTERDPDSLPDPIQWQTGEEMFARYRRVPLRIDALVDLEEFELCPFCRGDLVWMRFTLLNGRQDYWLWCRHCDRLREGE